MKYLWKKIKAEPSKRICLFLTLNMLISAVIPILLSAILVLIDRDMLQYKLEMFLAVGYAIVIFGFLGGCLTIMRDE